MGRGLCTFLALGIVLVLGGQAACVRAEGYVPAKSLHSHPATVPTAHSRDAAVPVLCQDDAVDRLAERDDDETWSPGDRGLWTNDFLHRPVEPALAPRTAFSRLGSSPKVSNTPPLRC